MSDQDRGWKISWASEGDKNTKAPDSARTEQRSQAAPAQTAEPQRPRLPSPTWIVGCGNMGGAIVEGWRAGGMDLSPGTAIRPSGTPVAGLRTVPTLAEAGDTPRLIILGFKPQKLDEIGPQLSAFVGPETVIVSLLAGVQIASLRTRFAGAAAIVRATPNLPVAIRRGVIALYSEDADEQTRQSLSGLFGALGYAPWMIDEAKFAAVGAVAGTGPAYVARFITALTKAAENQGLSGEFASTIALETVLGTAWLAATVGENMDSIARRVASPGGTTEAGLAVLDNQKVLDQLVAVAVEAGARRGAELANDADPASLAGKPSLH